MSQKYIGLSVSGCIKAILSGEVHPDMVEYIIPGFRLKNGIPETYYGNFWSHWSRPQIDAVISQVRIVERPENEEVYNIAHGEWVPAEFGTPDVFRDHEKRIFSHKIRHDRLVARHRPDRKWWEE